MKAVRGAEISMDTLNRKVDHGDDAPIWERLRRVDDHRLFTVFEALKSGVSVDEIFAITRIDRWFLSKIKHLADFEKTLSGDLTMEQYETGKRLGLHRRGPLPAQRRQASRPPGGGVQDGGHLRRRVRRRDALLLLHLRPCLRVPLFSPAPAGPW